MSDKLPIVIKNKQIARIGKELAILSKILPSKFDKWEWWNSLSSEWKAILYVNMRYPNKYLEVKDIEEYMDLNINSNELDNIMNIEKLSFSNYNYRTNFKINLNTIPDLSFLINLRAVDLSFCDLSNSNFDGLRNENLKQIALGCCNIGDVELSNLLNNLNKKVNKLDFFNNNITLKDIDFREFNDLKELYLSSNSFSSINLDDFMNIETLDFSSNYSEDFKVIYRKDFFYKFKNLRFCNNLLNDIEFIYQCKDLEFLDMSYNKLTKAEKMINLTKLKFLNLSACGVCDKDIEYFVELDKLEEIDIGHKMNGDYHFEWVWDYMENLGIKNQISIEKVVYLMNNLPNCKIESLYNDDEINKEKLSKERLDSLLGLKYLFSGFKQ